MFGSIFCRLFEREIYPSHSNNNTSFQVISKVFLFLARICMNFELEWPHDNITPTH